MSVHVPEKGPDCGKGDSSAMREKPVQLAISHYLADSVTGQETLSRGGQIISKAAGIELASYILLPFCYFRPRHNRPHWSFRCSFDPQEAAMFPMIRARWDAHSLSRKLRKSLAALEDKWKVDTDEDGQPTLSSGEFRIVLVPRAARLLDAIHLYNNDAEIWLPFLSRLRLRAAARLRLIQDANEDWKQPEQKKKRARRRRAKPSV
jgi:hypothetical protein